MAGYELTWITPDLAVGYAPMSYDDLEAIKEAGISAIVNLCAEYCDLHEIEEKAGFDVYYLPIPDEHAPDLDEMEKALDWLDEAIFLGKKVLVHCKHGIGRTGTFVTAYLIRKGLGYKKASKILEGTRANSATWSQWRLLKKYDKVQRPLTIREPSLESRHKVDLSVYFSKYDQVLEAADKMIGPFSSFCGKQVTDCCNKYFEMSFLEALYIHNHINTRISLRKRKILVQKAIDTLRQFRDGEDDFGVSVVCPLLEESCVIFSIRPLRCRFFGIDLHNDQASKENLFQIVFEVSRMLFFALSGKFLQPGAMQFSCAEVVSGRFMERYFKYAASLEN